MKSNDERLLRSSSYRKEFFYNTPPDKYTKHGTPVYHCAYCGKALFPEELQVDHIISVSYAKKHRGGRDKLIYYRMKDINSPKNLTAACPYCNISKGEKGGLWITKGFIGKNKYVWYVRKTIRWTLFIGLIVYLFWKRIVTPESILQFIKGPFFQ